MNILSIDTSTKNFSICVSRDEKILKQRNLTLNKVLSDSITPAIQSILKQSGLKLSQIDGFAVGLGPGSFTSLRVGVATVKALAFATKKKIVGMSSLDVLALNVQEQEAQVCVLCDARRNLVYSCIYQKKGKTLRKKSPYLLTDIKTVLARLKGETVFIGDGIDLYKKDIQKEKKRIKAIFCDPKLWYPQASCLAVLALERFRKKKYDDINKLVPLYLYPKDCQVVRKQSRK